MSKYDISEEYLREHYVNKDKSTRQICEELGIKSKTVILRLLKKYKIPAKTNRKGRAVPNLRKVGYKQISGAYWNRIKHGAINRNIDFSISIQYAWSIFEKQKGVCALSGLNIGFIEIWNVDKLSQQTASLDRIDSLKGYTQNNIQWVHKTVNKMKQNLSQKEFVKMCNLISDYDNNLL